MNWENLDELKKLTRFKSSTHHGESDLRSLEEYIASMNKDQKDIYYITGESQTAVEASPHLEVFKAKEIEVLYMTDPIDEWVVQSLTECEGKKLQSVTKGDLDLGKLSKEEKAEQKEGKSQFKNLTKFIQESFSDKLKEVRVTTRLKDSPSCLVADETDMGANMERIMKMANQNVAESKRILEINPSHPVMKNLNKIYQEDSSNPKVKEWCELVLDQALLAEGSPIENPTGFISKINKLLEDVSGR